MVAPHLATFHTVGALIKNPQNRAETGGKIKETFLVRFNTYQIGMLRHQRMQFRGQSNHAEL